MNWAAIILAAGFSSRMGRSKVLLPWGGTTVIGHLLEQYRQLGADQIAVVIRPDDAPLQAELDRLQFPRANRINNPAPEQGMFSSVQCAARWEGWKPGLTHWLLSLGDQPHLKYETLKTVVAFGSAHPDQICQPLQGGHRRHPIWFPMSLFHRLQSTSASNLKEFLNQHASSSAFCELSDPGLQLDLDHPEDYERALLISSKTGP